MTVKIPFTVIGGYLGAGKTTLLNHLLSNIQGMRIAVLVNDFGSINIDASLIRSHEGDTINLANGCMCCSIADNFAIVMGQLRDRATDFDHIIIEASGVANPAKIAQYGQMYKLPLNGILLVVNAEQIRTQAQNKYVGDTVIRQFTQADLIILNKTDLVPVADLTSLRTWIANLAPRIPVIETVKAEVPIEVLLGSHEVHAIATTLLNRANRKHKHQYEYKHKHENLHYDEGHNHTFETWIIEQSYPLTRQDLERFAAGLGEDIYRAKGFVWLADDLDRRYIYQQVGTRSSVQPDIAWGNESHQTRLVVIGRKGATSAEAIEALLKKH
jgi:G3E family GTPase